MHQSLHPDHGTSLPLTPPSQESVPSPEELNGAGSTRRQFLAWLGRMAAATAVVGVVPLAGCESPNDTHRRVCKENPHFCDETKALIDLNNERPAVFQKHKIYFISPLIAPEPYFHIRLYNG